MRIPIINRFTCNPKQLNSFIQNIKSKGYIPILDYAKVLLLWIILIYKTIGDLNLNSSKSRQNKSWLNLKCLNQDTLR